MVGTGEGVIFGCYLSGVSSPTAKMITKHRNLQGDLSQPGPSCHPVSPGCLCQRLPSRAKAEGCHPSGWLLQGKGEAPIALPETQTQQSGVMEEAEQVSMESEERCGGTLFPDI